MIAPVYAAIAAVKSKKCLVKRYFVGNLSTVGCALPILLFALCLMSCVLSRTYEGWEHLPNDDVTLQVKYGDGNHNNDDKVIDKLIV